MEQKSENNFLKIYNNLFAEEKVLTEYNKDKEYFENN